MVETNVHYPTDGTLLLDAVRKLASIFGKYSDAKKIAGWRQYRSNYDRLYLLYRHAQKLRPSTSKNEEKKAERCKLIKEKYKRMIDYAMVLVAKSQVSLVTNASIITENDTVAINSFIAHGLRQIDQMERRILKEETIPSEEKVHSIFEPHSERISKGKAGVPQELGLRVAILEDQYGLLLHHRVMEKETDEKVTVKMVEQTQSKFPELKSCSFDKGFYSKENKISLEGLLDTVGMHKKGKRSKAEKEAEQTQAFKSARKGHSAVESAINALEVHGLDRCPDHDIEGFRRYVGFAVLARNVQKIGDILYKSDKRARKKRSRLRTV